MKRKLLKPVQKINRKQLVHAKRRDILEEKFEGLDGPIETRHALISLFLPSTVKMLMEDLEREVEALCGERYRHGKTHHRWGTQNGSAVLGNQRVAIERPRVRAKDGREVELATYERFQDGATFNDAVFVEGLKRVSHRDYEKGLPKIASSFGFKKSSVSRRWIKATAGKLEELQSRSLAALDIRAVFLDGKRFRKHGVLIALGLGVEGKKHVLGIYQCDTENSRSCLELLNDLERRGLSERGLLFVVDGGSGLNKALNEKYACDDRKNRRAIRVRCFAHKWRNIEAALGNQVEKALGLFWALRDAKDLSEAKLVSARLEGLLRDLNRSALESYLEAKDDLLAIHELKLSTSLKRFFSTTNPIESLNSMIEEDMRRVKKWKDSTHFQRWLATYCLATEKRMRRVRGAAQLPGLWILLRTLTEEKVFDSTEQVA